MKNKTTFTAAPAFPRGATWLNVDSLDLASLAGKVVLLHFWDYNNVYCLEAMPYLRAWHAKYEESKLALVGVHTPEFPFARSRGAVRTAVNALELHYPILLDNKFELWKAYANTFWPSYHVIDAEGRLRYSDVGEGAWLGVEAVIQDLLREAGHEGELPPPCEPVRHRDEPGMALWPVTPNVYTGYERGTVGNSEGAEAHRVVYYEEHEGPMKEGAFYLEGKWLNHRFCTAVAKAAEGTEASIHIPYTAAEVCMVVNPSGDQGFLVDVYDDKEALTEQNAGPHVRLVTEGGERRSQVLIHDPKMYRVIKHDRVRSGVLKVTARSSGFTVYAFTFLSASAKDGEEASEAMEAIADGSAMPSLEASVLSVPPAPPEAPAAEGEAEGEGAEGAEATAPAAEAGTKGRKKPSKKKKTAAPAAEEAAAQDGGEAGAAEPVAEVTSAPGEAAGEARPEQAAAASGGAPSASTEGAAAHDAMATSEPVADEPAPAEASSTDQVAAPADDAAAEAPASKAKAKAKPRKSRAKAAKAEPAATAEAEPAQAVEAAPAQAVEAASAQAAAPAAPEQPDTAADDAPAAPPPAPAPQDAPAAAEAGTPDGEAQAADSTAPAGEKKPRKSRAKAAKAQSPAPDEPRILLQLSRPRKRTVRKTKAKPEATTEAPKTEPRTDPKAQPKAKPRATAAAAGDPPAPAPKKPASRKKSGGANGGAANGHDAQTAPPSQQAEQAPAASASAAADPGSAAVEV